MKISHLEAIPMKSGLMIVRVFTNDGLYGLGECSGRNWKVLKPFIPDRPGHGLVLQEDALARLRLE